MGVALAVLGACTADVPAAPAEPALDVTAIRSDGVDATVQIGADRYAVSSRLESRPALVDPADPLAAGAPAEEVVRTTTVRSPSGETIATVQVAVDDGETTGAVADQPFGRPADEASDDDAALWAAILGSRDGQIVDAIAAAATARLDSESDGATAAFLTDLAQAAGTVHDLATDGADATDRATAAARVATSAQAPFTTLGWGFGPGPTRRILLVPNVGGAIGIHSAGDTLDVAKIRAVVQAEPTFTLGIREIEPSEYNTSRAYRRMVARLVAQAQGAAAGTQAIYLLFNSGRDGSHDPMTTLPGLGAPVAARALRALLRTHPAVRLPIELYCAGTMTASEWAGRRAKLGQWAAAVHVPRDRVTIDEDISDTTAASGEHYGAMGQLAHFNAMLAAEARAVRSGGWGGLDYVPTPPSGVYPTATSTYDAVHLIMSTY